MSHSNNTMANAVTYNYPSAHYPAPSSQSFSSFHGEDKAKLIEKIQASAKQLQKQKTFQERKQTELHDLRKLLLQI